ncbi:MAG: MerR family transcriptional regulator [Steroidobacteraceae bacterium]
MTLRIREAARTVGLSADTLRYYEKIDLVPRPARAVGGQRTYGEKDLARLRFVVRAQALGFTLKEIRQLLRFRENPVRCSKSVRKLARDKCETLAAQRLALEQTHRELALLLNLCSGASNHCPILERLESDR